MRALFQRCFRTLKRLVHERPIHYPVTADFHIQTYPYLFFIHLRSISKQYYWRHRWPINRFGVSFYKHTFDWINNSTVLTRFHGLCKVGALSTLTLRVLPAGVLDDWPSFNGKPEDELEEYGYVYPVSWLRLLRNTKTRLLRSIALKVMRFESHDDTSAELLVRHGLIEVLKDLAEKSMHMRGGHQLTRDITSLVATLSHYDFCNSEFAHDFWLDYLSRAAELEDQNIVKNTSTAINQLVLHRKLGKDAHKALVIVHKLLKNDYGEVEDVIKNIAELLHSLAGDKDICLEIAKTYLPLIQQSARRQPSDNVQVHMARLLKSCLLCTNDKKLLINEGWMDFIGFWSRSNDKHLKLATSEILEDAVKDDEVAIQILSEYGVQLFIEVASGLDIEPQLAMQRIVSRLAKSNLTNEYVESDLRRTMMVNDIKLDDDFMPTGWEHHENSH